MTRDFFCSSELATFCLNSAICLSRSLLSFSRSRKRCSPSSGKSNGALIGMDSRRRFNRRSSFHWRHTPCRRSRTRRSSSRFFRFVLVAASLSRVEASSSAAASKPALASARTWIREFKFSRSFKSCCNSPFFPPGENSLPCHAARNLRTSPGAVMPGPKLAL